MLLCLSERLFMFSMSDSWKSTAEDDCQSVGEPAAFGNIPGL